MCHHVRSVPTLRHISIFLHLFVATSLLLNACAPTPAPAPPSAATKPGVAAKSVTAGQPPSTAPNSNSPEGVVRRAYEALARRDTRAFLDLIDISIGRSIADQRLYQRQEVASILVQGLKGTNANPWNLTFRDLSIATMLTEGDSALVKVSGFVQSPPGANEQPIEGLEFVRKDRGLLGVGDQYTVNALQRSPLPVGSWLLSSPWFASNTDTPQDPAIKISLLGIFPDTGPFVQPEPGWSHYSTHFSVFNDSTRYVPSRIRSVSQSSVTAHGGQTYPASVRIFSDIYEGNLDNRSLANGGSIPPGARLKYTTLCSGRECGKYFMKSTYKLPSTLSTQKITLGSGIFGVDDIDNSSSLFANSEPSNTRDLPAVLEIPGLATLEIGKPEQGSEHPIHQNVTTVKYSIKFTSLVADTNIYLPIIAAIFLDSGSFTKVGCGGASDSHMLPFGGVSLGPLQSETISCNSNYILKQDSQSKKWLVLDGITTGTFRF